MPIRGRRGESGTNSGFWGGNKDRSRDRFSGRRSDEFIFAETSSIPQAAVFDRKGRLAAKTTGFDDKIRKQLDAAAERAVKSE